MTNLKAIRKLPELKAHQEWACEGGCDHIHPKHFESVFSSSFGHGGGLIERQSEFYYTCQDNHLLAVWDNNAGDYVVLPEEYYTADEDKILKTESIQDSIDFLDNEINELKDGLIEDAFLSNEQSDILEDIVNKSIQFGQLVERRDRAKPIHWIDNSLQKPELIYKSCEFDCSVALNFHVRGSGTYHGHYVARNVPNGDQTLVEYVFITSTVVDEEKRVFANESVEAWMYCPELGLDDVLVSSFESVNPVLGVGNWVKTFDAMPQLHEPEEDGRNYSSKELFFTIRDGIYHGWYIACDEVDEDTGHEEENYYFSANIGDELFPVDQVECWMYCPELSVANELN